jgi:hypothetical protein
MPCELDPVTVKPATSDDGEAIEASDALLREQRGEDVANNTTNCVGCKDLCQVEREGADNPSDIEFWKAHQDSALTSRESSYPAKNFSCVAKLQMVPAMTPNRTAAAMNEEKTEVFSRE